MRRIRTSALVIALLALAFLVLASPQASKASGPGETAITGNPQAHPELFSPPEAGPTENAACSAASENEMAVNPCKDCPKSLAPGCSRVSCDPCCFRCPGDPILRCL